MTTGMEESLSIETEMQQGRVGLRRHERQSVMHEGGGPGGGAVEGKDRKVGGETAVTVNCILNLQ